MVTRLHIKVTYYSSCEHVCILDNLEESVNDIIEKIERHGAKRSRKNRYTLIFETPVNEETVEDKLQEEIRKGPIQQWSFKWVQHNDELLTL